MPINYTAPIGALPDGTPMPAESLNGGGSGLLGQILGSKMTGGIPIPSLTGGDAAPSAAGGGSAKNFINNISGGGAGTILILGFVGIVGFIVWKKFK